MESKSSFFGSSVVENQLGPAFLEICIVSRVVLDLQTTIYIVLNSFEIP